jgi:hypothetical protein
MQSAKAVVPKTCSYYNSGKGCGWKDTCTYLHVCKNFLAETCNGTPACQLSHDIFDQQPKAALETMGFNVSGSRQALLVELRRVMEDQLKQAAEEQGAAEKDPEICVFHLRGKCTFGPSCKHHHPPTAPPPRGGRPYLWQRCKGSEPWVDFSEECQDDIELNYCNPSKDECFANYAAQVYRIRFAEMLCSWLHPDTGEVVDPVRRLSTKSSLAGTSDKHRYLTLWRWYWSDDDGAWYEYGQDVDGAKLSGSVTSSELEQEYESDPEGIFSFVRDSSTYQVNFGAMIQINVASGFYREVRRRPEKFDTVTKRPQVGLEALVAG